ncbi:MAG: ABC-F family ATP-binding cassette domain-containing protein, partial [Candidatus Krumholzibacteriota bacterium]|nr:ABC-F family ATP-binding cassette domain-containing protein [Candidatus Krumholzibacteriota bacterium]
PDAGRLRSGKDVDAGYFDQQLDLVSDANTVAEEFRTVDPLMTEGELRSQLARFGFYEDDLDKKVGQLSGGERNRLSLLKLVYQRHNFLVLDEPTNHLDIPATESLEEALEAYEGTLLVVSHDRAFLERLVTRVIEVKDGTVADYPGPWRDFVAWRHARREDGAAAGSETAGGAAGGDGPGDAAAADSGAAARNASGHNASADGRTPGGAARWSKNRLARRRRELADLETSITAAQAEKAAVEASLAASHALGREEIMRLTARHQELSAALERREERWARWAEELEDQEA